MKNERTSTAGDRGRAAPAFAALCTALLLTVPGIAGATEPGRTGVEAGALAGDTSWGGAVSVTGPVTVPEGSTLTIEAGADVRFGPGAGIQVHGTLVAEGTAARPVLLSGTEARPGHWTGVTLAAAGTASRLLHCRVRDAGQVKLTAGTHLIEGCEFTGSTRGIVVNGKETRPRIADSRFTDLPEGGLRFDGGSGGLVENNRIERCGPFGISAVQGASPVIRGNTVAECASGIELFQVEPQIRDNTIRSCTRGIALTSAGGGRPVTGNLVEECETGILVQQYSAPELTGNTVRANRDGIICYLGAEPRIAGNRILLNETGLFCNQLARPLVEDNTIERNRRGVYLDLSSYAIIRRNNIMENDVQLELGNMSLDWERRAGHKPMRGRQQQLRTRAERGVGVMKPGAADGFEGPGFVDARENWWGEEMTQEMEKKGPEANLSGLIDGYDVPVRTYEGWEGEYLQDRIVYAPWAAVRLHGTTVPVPGPGEGGAP